MNQNRIQKSNKLKILSKVLLIIIGGFITAYGLEAILIPNNVSDGGVTGLSIVGSQLFGLPLGSVISRSARALPYIRSSVLLHLQLAPV